MFFAKLGRGQEVIRLCGSETLEAWREHRRVLRRHDMPEIRKQREFDSFVCRYVRDGFAIIGMVTDHWIFSWPGAHTRSGVPYLSEPAILATLTARICEDPSHDILDKICRVCDMPLVIAPQPCPSKADLKSTREFQRFKRFINRPLETSGLRCWIRQIATFSSL